MALYDELLKALDSIDDWLVVVTQEPQHTDVYVDARKPLSAWLSTLEGEDIEAALAALAGDVETLKQCTGRLIKVAKTITTAQSIVDDVGTVMNILAEVFTAPGL